MIVLNEDMLRTVLREYIEHYHHERNHQSIGNVIPFPRAGPEPGSTEAPGPIVRSSRLGGLLNHYFRRCA